MPLFGCRWMASHPFWLTELFSQSGRVGGRKLATLLPSAANKWQLAGRGRLR